MKRFDYIKSDDPYLVTNSGARIDAGALCEHGQAAVFVALFGNLLSQPDESTRRDTIMPRCVLAQLFGAIHAQILHEEGEAALQAFRDDTDSHVQASLTALQEMRAQARDCCEAGFRTGGSEHTCGRSEAAQ
ncbi:hypothetical protein ACIQVK_25355 [Streptomyces sp. NPDC090493]|uniref:hypothetical protein n=1 Tax=Streptomyces sp. NPDC090493 TaxID=3365964 RepID=UPI0037F2233D